MSKQDDEAALVATINSAKTQLYAQLHSLVRCSPKQLRDLPYASFEDACRVLITATETKIAKAMAAHEKKWP